jgi:hypothetical protein
METKIRAGCVAFEVTVSRIAVPTGPPTSGGLSDPSALRVKWAGRTAVAAPLEDGMLVVVAAVDVVAGAG